MGVLPEDMDRSGNNPGVVTDTDRQEENTLSPSGAGSKGLAARKTVEQREFFEEVPFGIATLGRRGSVLKANTGLAGLLGVEQASLRGTVFSKFISDRSKKTFHMHMREVLASGRDKLCEVVLLRSDGSSIHSIVKSLPVKGKEGHIRSIRSIFIDLGSEKAVRENLSPMAGELNTLVESVPYGIFRLDRDLGYVFANSAMSEFTGLPGEALVNPSPNDRDLLAGHLLRSIKKAARKVFQTGLPREFETVFDLANKRCHLHVHLVPETGKDGKAVTLTGTVRDIKWLKHNEEALRIEHSFREAIERSIKIGIGAIDDRGRQIYVNPAFCRIVGWSREELLGKRFPYVYWPLEEEERARRTFAKLLKGRKRSSSFEVKLKRRNGTYFDAIILYSAFYDGSGRRIGWVGSVGDISDLKKRENDLKKLNQKLNEIVKERTAHLKAQNRRLKETLVHFARSQKDLQLVRNGLLSEKQRLQTILDVTPTGLMIIEGKDGRITYLNRRAHSLFGRKPPPFLKMVDQAFHLKFCRPDGSVFPYEEFPVGRALLRGEKVWGEEVTIVRSAGNTISVHVNATPLVIGGEIVGAVASFADITKIKRSEESIKLLNMELSKNLLLVEDTKKELEAFVQSVTHDLRSPLIVVNGFSRRLLELSKEGFEEKSREYIGYIRETSQNALYMIRDLLKLFKISKGEIKRTPVDLGQLARSLHRDFRDLYPERLSEFLVHNDIAVYGDYNLLKIVLENLIGNSYKFTAKNDGGAIIEFGSYETEEGPVVFVRDNGCGFDISSAQGLFEPFVRFHEERDYKGTGIGLATVRRIIHRHGGRIWVESEPGKGATFFFTLPG